MPAIRSFFESLLTWSHQLFVGESPLAILSFWIGLISLVAGILAMIYASKSATRSDRLLKRLVVYPFRDLDLAMSNLTPLQREELLQIYNKFGNRKFQASDALPILGQFANATLDLLVEEKWLVREVNDVAKFRVNNERRPYLAFFVEANSVNNIKS